MSYDYQKERPGLFTDEGQRMLLSVRDRTQRMLAASGARHESRGSLKRLDFPERDDEQFLAHSMVNASGQISWQPVHIVNMPPKAREY